MVYSGWNIAFSSKKLYIYIYLFAFNVSVNQVEYMVHGAWNITFSR